MRRSGFSLIEVNMAVFVLAIGVLSMAVLYPLGLRESIQSQADIKQSMFADYILNVAVAAAGNTNVNWSEWDTQTYKIDWGQDNPPSVGNIGNAVPPFVLNAVDAAVKQYNNNQLPGFQHTRNQTYAIYCIVAGGPYIFDPKKRETEQNVAPSSTRIMGIMVRSLDVDTSKMKEPEKIKRLEAQDLYYAEARFMGFADR